MSIGNDLDLAWQPLGFTVCEGSGANEENVAITVFSEGSKLCF